VSDATKRLIDAAQAVYEHRYQMGAPMLGIYDELKAADAAQPKPGTVRFDIPAADAFNVSGRSYPIYTCMDCRKFAYGIRLIEHRPKCRVLAALKSLQPKEKP
jgi:hypothetical protein